MAALRRLGRSDIEITRIGLGCWQFSQGKLSSGAYWPELPDAVTDEIVAVSLRGGINWFDTAEAYGFGASERGLSRSLRAAGRANGDVRVATKWFPLARTAGSIRRSIDERLACLHPFEIDLYQIHQPIALATVGAQMDAMADIADAGKIRTVGVSNFSASRMRAAHAALAKRERPLVSNQVKYSLLDRRIESNGVMAAAKELGITIIAYSPLEQGLLSGKFHDDPALVRGARWTRRMRGGLSDRAIARTRPVIDAVKEIAAAHGATPSQVALAWLASFHGDTVVVIPGATKTRHAEENVGALDLALSVKECARLDDVSRAVG